MDINPLHKQILVNFQERANSPSNDSMITSHNIKTVKKYHSVRLKEPPKISFRREGHRVTKSKSLKHNRKINLNLAMNNSHNSNNNFINFEKTNKLGVE